MRPLALALALALVAPLVAAQATIPGSADAKTDGVPLDKDSPDVLAAMNAVRADISGQSIHDCVLAITTEGPEQYRVMGTPTHDMFLTDHQDVFSKLGLASATQHFANGSVGLGGPAQSPLQGGTNLVAVLPGKDLTKWVVMGGHYDTREETVGGGALDNAAGMCTVLELARAYKSSSDKHGPLAASMVFAWYDGEEWGLYGSIAFAQDKAVAKKLLNLSADAPVDVLVSQSYDMPGLNYPAKNTWVQYGDPTTVDKYAVLNLRTAPTHAEQNWTCWTYGCYEKLKQRDDFARILDRNTRYQALQREVAYDLLQLPRQYVWVYDDSYGRSDHIPLIADGAAGGRIQGSHDEEYPHYHHATDTLPALYELAGGKDLLIQGFQTEAQAGGLAAFYVALTGDVGHYAPTTAATGDVTTAAVPGSTAPAPGGATSAKAAPGAASGTSGGAPAKGTPAWTTDAALLALALVAMTRSRRR